ncbi:MAG: hypothetical protein ACK500_01580 [Flavobacteriales bacterium]
MQTALVIILVCASFAFLWRHFSAQWKAREGCESCHFKDSAR